MKKMKEISPKKWGICAITAIVVMILGMALLTYIVDPYFHYHAPLPGMSYRLYEQRYINDGISRHFEYDAVVIGNSLSENVKTSEVDVLFDCNSIKLPYSGAGYNELWGSLEKTLSYNPAIRKVIVFADAEDMARKKDYMRYTDYPDYLYDDNLWNDASYLWNKDIFYRGTLYNIFMTIVGKESTTFDEYSAKEGKTGAEVVLSYVGDIPEPEDAESWKYEEKDEQKVRDNINANIIAVVEKYPNVEFYLIYPPPSIARWGKYYIWGDINYRIEACKTATRLLLEEDNIHIYSFQDDFELVCNLDNYRDTVHYTSEVSSYILEIVSRDQRKLTEENFDEYFERITEFYTGYDYQSLRMDEYFKDD